MTYKIDTINRLPKAETFYFKIKDKDLLDAFRNAKEKSKKKYCELTVEMITHCLKEAGYLK